MKQHAAAFPFSRPQHRQMTTPRRPLRLLIFTVCLSLVQPLVAVAQTNAPAPLPPAAQEALNKGIIAAKVPDYLLAIRFFEEARKLAPQAPVIYLNLGLAESRIPGRELRAMAWFGAYLAAYPEAPNAAAVKEQIAVLDIRYQSNISRLIKSVQDAVSQMPWGRRNNDWGNVAKLWAEAGHISAALKTVDLIEGADSKDTTWSGIVAAQAESGDITGAQKTVNLIGAQKTANPILHALSFTYARRKIAEAQIKAGDTTGAQNTFASALKTAELIEDASTKSFAHRRIAEAQAKTGDIAGAQKTTDLIQDASDKSKAQEAIAEAQAKAGITNAPNSTRQSGTQPRIQPVIAVSDWLKKLDDGNKNNDCPLNTEPFLDLAGYLKSLPPSGNPEKVFESLHKTAEKIVKAQNVIHQMLKQQAKR